MCFPRALAHRLLRTTTQDRRWPAVSWHVATFGGLGPAQLLHRGLSRRCPRALSSIDLRGVGKLGLQPDDCKVVLHTQAHTFRHPEEIAAFTIDLGENGHDFCS